MTDIINRSDARDIGQAWYFNGKPCPKGHIAKRATKSGSCYECSRIKGEKRRKEKPNDSAIRAKKWRERNPERVKAYRDNYYEENKDEINRKIKEKRSKAPLQPRAQAILEGKTLYWTGKPCPEGHITFRRTINGICMECDRAKNNNYKKENAEPIAEYNRKYAQEHKDEINENQKRRNRKFKKENPEEYKRRNSEKHRRYVSTPHGQLRKMCKDINYRLKVPESSGYVMSLLDYTAEELCGSLLNPFPQYSHMQEAWDDGYHIDHIIPVKFVSDNIADRILAFRVVSDIQNQRLILAGKNIGKGGRLTQQARELIPILWKKYDLEVPAKF